MRPLCEDLATFSLFCGFNDISTHEVYSKRFGSLFHSLDDEPQVSPSRDDEWLSAHFFLTTSKEKLDVVYESMVNIEIQHHREEQVITDIDYLHTLLVMTVWHRKQ
jgi:hypothetical protein